MTEKEKRKGNYNQTKNPRLIEARRLRRNGATDEEQRRIYRNRDIACHRAVFVDKLPTM